MSATVFVEKEEIRHLRLYNDSGAAVVQGEFCVIGGIAAVADEDVSSGSVGSFHVEEGIVLQASEYVSASEDTFATGGQKVYWDPVTKLFSDTRKAGYLAVGTVVEVISSTVIRFAKRFFAEPVVVKCAEVVIDAATDYSSTGKSVPLPVGSKIVDVVAICTAANTAGTAQVVNGSTALHTALVMAVDQTINRMAAAVNDAAMDVGTDAITVKTHAIGDAGIVLVYYI
jgi:hypothetical protein